MNSNKDHFDFDDPLDRLLPMATWPQTPPATMDRLRESFIQRWRTNRWPVRSALIAASIALVSAAILFVRMPKTSEPRLSNHIEPAAPHAVVSSVQPVREFTIRDQFLLMLAEQKSPPVPVEIERSAPSPNPIVDALSQPLMEARMSAARRLGAQNDPQVTQTLIALAEGDQLRREALIALKHSRRQEARDFLARARRSQEMASLVRSIDLQMSGNARLSREIS